jgi:hypothetical protein
MLDDSSYDYIYVSKGISDVDAILGSLTGTAGAYASNEDPTASVAVNAGKYKGKIYYVKFYQEGSLIRDLIPCKSNAEDIGLFFDKVSKKIFRSSGTAYIAGPVVEDND